MPRFSVQTHRRFKVYFLRTWHFPRIELHFLPWKSGHFEELRFLPNSFFYRKKTHMEHMDITYTNMMDIYIYKHGNIQCFSAWTAAFFTEKFLFQGLWPCTFPVRIYNILKFWLVYTFQGWRWIFYLENRAIFKGFVFTQTFHFHWSFHHLDITLARP